MNSLKAVPLRMKARLASIFRAQEGITGLETSIILIAFVVVASVFAFTVLSTGLFSSDERGKETIRAGLNEVRGSVGLRGSVIATASTATSTSVDTVVFVVTNSVAGVAVDLTVPLDAGDDGLPDSGSGHKAVVSFSDKNQSIPDVAWTISYIGNNDGDTLLEIGEKAQITAKVGKAITANSGTDLGVDTEFNLEVKPPAGGLLIIQRVTPASIDVSMELS